MNEYENIVTIIIIVIILMIMINDQYHQHHHHLNHHQHHYRRHHRRHQYPPWCTVKRLTLGLAIDRYFTPDSSVKVTPSHSTSSTTRVQTMLQKRIRQMRFLVRPSKHIIVESSGTGTKFWVGTYDRVPRSVRRCVATTPSSPRGKNVSMAYPGLGS